MRVLHTAADTTGTAGATGKHSGDGIGVSALVGAAVRSVMAPLSTLARVVRGDALAKLSQLLLHLT